jgi:uncharacterized protein YigA (DUF484 family)
METLETLRKRIEELENVLQNICTKCRSNEWGTDTPRKEILNTIHDMAAEGLDPEQPQVE